MPPPQSVDDAARALGDVYRLAEQRINAELQRILTDPNQGNRIRRLRALDAEIARRTANLEGEARAFLNNSLPIAWKSGAVNRSTNGSFTWTQAHRQALGILANDSFDRVLKSTRFMRRDVKALIRVESATAARLKVATGETAQQAGRSLATRLKATGITSVTYSDGRHIRASTYTEMVMRTSTALAYNEGGLNQLVQQGVRYVEMIDGADCGLVAHGDPFKVNGKVLPVEVAATYPISHPNCRRDFVARPDVKTDEGAAVASSWRSPSQLADQAQFERLLQAKVERRQVRNARAARQARAAQVRTTRQPRQARVSRSTTTTRARAGAGAASSARRASTSDPKAGAPLTASSLRELYGDRLTVHPGMRPEDLQARLDRLAQLPKDWHDTFIGKGGRISLGPGGVGKFSDWGGSSKTHDGRSWSDVGGAFDPSTKTAYIGVGGSGSASVSIHEFAHAYDWAAGNLSSGEAFMRQWSKIEDERNINPYFRRGPSPQKEWFAEGTAAHATGNASTMLSLTAGHPEQRAFLITYLESLGIRPDPNNNPAGYYDLVRPKSGAR